MNELFVKNLEILQEKSPTIAFFLQFHNLEKEQANIRFQKLPISLQDIDLLYIYGVNVFSYLSIKEWLDSDSIREVVFIEDDLDELYIFFSKKTSCTFLKDERIHFVYISTSCDKSYKDLANRFPTTCMEVIPSKAYLKHKREKFEKIRLELLRKTSLVDAFFTENLRSADVFNNFVRNSSKFSEVFLPSGFKNLFKNTPAIVCGAGPSLSQDKQLLKELENKALIIAGGSAIAALSSSITPHLGVAIDPNFDEYLRFKGSFAFEMPLFFSSRLFYSVLNTTNGFLGYLPAKRRGERWLEEYLQLDLEEVEKDLPEESFSVTSVAIALALFLGCNPIILSGVDLAYVNNRRYSEEVVVYDKPSLKEIESGKISSERLITTASFPSAVKWVMEAKAISDIVASNPSINFFRTSTKGLPIDGLATMPLSEFLKQHSTSYDVRGRVMCHILQNKLEMLPETLSYFFDEIEMSLKKCYKLLSDIIMSSNRESSFLAQVSLKEEKAYRHLLHDIELVLDHILLRLAKRKVEASEKDKWNYLKKTVNDYLCSFNVINR